MKQFCFVILASLAVSCAPPLEPAPTAIGAAKGTATSGLVGASGGTVQSSDGRLTVEVPAGALAADTTISVQPLDNKAHGRVGDGYRLTPEGTTFGKPVTLTFTYSDADLAGSSVEALGVAFQTAERFWQWVDGATVDQAAKKVKVTTTHFSDWSLVQGFQLTPGSASVPTGGSVPLRTVYCYAVTDEELTPLAYNCAGEGELVPLVPIENVQEWSVNGRTNGNNSVGRISGSGNQVTYAAPSTEPDDNPVAVSAKVKWGSKGSVLATSNINVGDARSYVGTVTFNQTEGTNRTYTGTAQLTWKRSGRNSSETRYQPTGTLTADIAWPNCEPVSHTFEVTPTADAASIGMRVFNKEVPVYGQSYFFQIAVQADLTMKCNGSTGSHGVSVVINTQGCTTPKWSELDTLAASYQCDDGTLNQNVSWDLKLQ